MLNAMNRLAGLVLALLVVVSCERSPGGDRSAGGATVPSSVQAPAAARGKRPALTGATVTLVPGFQPDGRTRFALTGLVTDPDQDVTGGILRLRLINLGNQLFEARLLRVQAGQAAHHEESVTTAAGAGTLEAVTFDGIQLRAVFVVFTPPSSFLLKTSATVQDVKGNRSSEVRLTTPIPPVRRFDGRYTGTTIVCFVLDGVPVTLGPGPGNVFGFLVSNGELRITQSDFAGGNFAGIQGVAVDASGRVFLKFAKRGTRCTMDGELRDDQGSGGIDCSGSFRDPLPFGHYCWSARRLP